VALKNFGPSQWLAGIYLGVGGGAAAFILWVMALERATPTRVANTMTVNPIAAALLAAWLIGEPITPDLIIGLIAVFAGIWLATCDVRKRKMAEQAQCPLSGGTGPASLRPGLSPQQAECRKRRKAERGGDDQHPASHHFDQ